MLHSEQKLTFQKMDEEERDIKKEKFLELLKGKNYHIGKTCDSIGVARNSFYRWRDSDSTFRAKYEEITEFDIDDSEENMRLLRQGVPEFGPNGVFKKWKVRPHFQALLTHLQSKGTDRGWGRTIQSNIDPNADLRQMSDKQIFDEFLKIGENIKSKDE